MKITWTELLQEVHKRYPTGSSANVAAKTKFAGHNPEAYFLSLEVFIRPVRWNLFLREPPLIVTFLQALHSVKRDLPVKLLLIGALQGRIGRCGVYINPHH